MQPAPAGKLANLASFMDRVRAAPWKFSFLSLVRSFNAWHPERPRLGEATRPRQEPMRLGQAASLVFAPREVAELVIPEEAADQGLSLQMASNGMQVRTLPLLRIYGLGMLGPNGPLPLHYTELVRERAENHRDPTLSDFLDLFHHRFLSHFYRAWAQGQAAAGLDRIDDETFSRYVAHLVGHDPVEIRAGVLPAHARLAASPHLASESRHSDGLAASLAHFFGLNVRVEEFAMHWLRIDKADATRLGHTDTASRLGKGAIAGEEVADRQSRIRLVFGPMNLEQYERFTPEGEDIALVIEWVRAFTGLELAWELELTLDARCAPSATLGAAGKLGWSAWLGTPTGQPWSGGTAPPFAKWRREALSITRGMIFEPECRATPTLARLVDPASAIPITART